MSKFYNEALFIDKNTNKVIWRLVSKPFSEKHPHFNKFYWNKEKQEVLERLIKDRFLNKHEIEIRDYSRAIEND